jgi:predicted O-methyltransferase YrrM
VAHKLFQVKSYLLYWLNAVDEHSLHSPFFFDFYTQVVKDNTRQKSIESVEKFRRKFLSDTQKININDLGSGNKNGQQSISSIANRCLSYPRFSYLYRKMIKHYQAKTIVELGTSLGINALYLAQEKDATVVTFEGSDALADVAEHAFDVVGAKNIRLIRGQIDNTLSVYLQSIRKIDFAFIDANHRYNSTLAYFEQLLSKITETTIFVLDDIYYSPEMAKAWNEIRQHRLVYGSANLFRCGILFFDPSLNKQHVILQL